VNKIKMKANLSGQLLIQSMGLNFGLSVNDVTIAETCFLCVGSVQSGYKRGEFRGWQFRGQSSEFEAVGGKSCGKFVEEVSL
jgi:hypothetical protein